METLAERYKQVCQDYADALNKMWEANGEWIDENLWWFDVAGCIIGIADVRLCVENNIPLGTFINWYEYDMQISYAKEIGKSAERINLYSWIHGFPEEHKAPESVRQEWEREYWKMKLEEEYFTNETPFNEQPLYRQGYEDAIDKAYEWLKARNVLTDASLEGFKKAMEE